MDRAGENHPAQQGSDFPQSRLTPPDPTGSAVSVQSVWFLAAEDFDLGPRGERMTPGCSLPSLSSRSRYGAGILTSPLNAEKTPTRSRRGHRSRQEQ